MHEGVAIIEGHDVLNGEILECNHAMCELSGVATPDQLRGTSLRQILPQVSGISSEEKIFEICFAGSDSVTRCCEATFKKFQGTPERIALVIRDRTWKKELETQATQLMVRAAHVNTLNNQLKWVQHQVKNSALALEFRLHQVLDVMVQEQVYAVVDGIEVQFAALQNEVDNLTKSLDDHVKLGEIASGQYVPRYPEHSAKDILRQLFRELDDVEVNCMFRARVDIDTLHHATSNLESNANKYKRISPESKVVKTVRMCKNVHPAPSAFDAVVVQGLQIGDRVPTGPEQGATIMALLHIAVSNEVTPDDFEMLKALHSKLRLHSLCKPAFALLVSGTHPRLQVKGWH